MAAISCSLMVTDDLPPLETELESSGLLSERPAGALPGWQTMLSCLPHEPVVVSRYCFSTATGGRWVVVWRVLARATAKRAKRTRRIDRAIFSGLKMERHELVSVRMIGRAAYCLGCFEVFLEEEEERVDCLDDLPAPTCWSFIPKRSPLVCLSSTAVLEVLMVLAV